MVCRQLELWLVAARLWIGGGDGLSSDEPIKEADREIAVAESEGVTGLGKIDERETRATRAVESCRRDRRSYFRARHCPSYWPRGKMLRRSKLKIRPPPG